MKLFVAIVVTSFAGLSAWSIHVLRESDPPVATPIVVSPIENPQIDMAGFLALAHDAATHRETRRVTEREFLRMSGEPGTIVLDARSGEMFQMLHIKGAINLSFPDIAIASLEQTIPDKSTRILIYCNNNFRNAERPFASKMPAASLNLSTYATLYNYGYRNVYELGPVLDPKASILPFESSTTSHWQVYLDNMPAPGGTS